MKPPCARLFAVVFLALLSVAAVAGETRLAIINKHRDPAVGDLLFSKLASSGDFSLVERGQLARILGEQVLSSQSRESNVRTGQLAGAEALLFVEPDRSLLHLRLVETHRGERVSMPSSIPRSRIFQRSSKRRKRTSPRSLASCARRRARGSTSPSVHCDVQSNSRLCRYPCDAFDADRRPAQPE